jgi:hypothetical protein
MQLLPRLVNSNVLFSMGTLGRSLGKATESARAFINISFVAIVISCALEQN